jgi:hypothetical protein
MLQAEQDGFAGFGGVRERDMLRSSVVAIFELELDVLATGERR